MGSEGAKLRYTVATRLSGSERAVALLEAWRIADADTDIEIRYGRTSEGEPCITVSVGAADMHALTVAEADILAGIVERTIKQFPEASAHEGLDNLLLGLRQGIVAAQATPEPPDGH